MATETPKAWRRSVMGAAIETTTGTPVTALAADGVFNVYNFDIQEDSETEERNGQNSFSQLPPVPNAQGGSCTFFTDVYNDVSTPFWLSRLLTACGFALNTGVYKPSTGAAETITISHWRDGMLEQLAGCQGSVRFIFNYGKAVKAQWNFKGVWVQPTDAVNIAPTFPTDPPPRFMGATLQVNPGGAGNVTGLRVSQMEIAVENEITLRPDQSTSSGYHAAFIVDRKITTTMDPEAQPIATVNWFNQRETGVASVLNCAIGSGTNGIITFGAPALYHVRPPKDKNRGKIYAHDLAWRHARGAAAGDDELSITPS